MAQFTKGFFGPIPDFDKGMEKTPDHRDLVEQSLPRILSGLPAISIDRFWGIIGLQGLGFAGKDAVGVLSIDLGSGHGHRCPQDAVVRRSRGDVNAFTFQPAMLFIGDEVLGQLLGTFDRRAH